MAIVFAVPFFVVTLGIICCVTSYQRKINNLPDSDLSTDEAIREERRATHYVIGKYGPRDRRTFIQKTEEEMNLNTQRNYNSVPDTARTQTGGYDERATGNFGGVEVQMSPL